MKEFDPESAELLDSFKHWSDENFGSAALAFKALDEDGGGSISLLEFRRGCQSLNWPGDATLLFECLDTADHIGSVGLDRSTSASVASKRGLTLKDVAFLDSWTSTLSQEERVDIEEKTWAEVERNKPLCRQKSPRIRLCSSTPSFSATTSTMTAISTSSSVHSWTKKGSSMHRTAPPLSSSWPSDESVYRSEEIFNAMFGVESTARPSSSGFGAKHGSLKQLRHLPRGKRNVASELKELRLAPPRRIGKAW